jgi:hypothetical protein
MRYTLAAAVLAIAFGAPALAAPPAKPPLTPPGSQAPLPLKPPESDPFDLRTAPQLDDNVVQPPRDSLKTPREPYRPMPEDEQRFQLCPLDEAVVLSQCESVKPRGKPKLYLLTPDMRAYSSTSRPRQ